MKLVPFLAVALAVCVSSAQQVPIEDAGFAPVVVGQELHMTPALRRHLQTGSSSTETPSTTTPATTTATPATTTATPTTRAPTPTTRAPTPTTRAPTPTTATPTTTAPTPTTATPSTTTATPTATTATPTSTSETTETPSSTTATPDATTATPSATSAASSTSADTSTDTTTDNPTTSSSSGTAVTSSPSATESAVSSTSGSTSSAGADTSSGSSMSTGAVIGIVVGIVAAVAIIACIIMCAIRKRRDADDDPLSPFELSMDKGYNPSVNAQNAYNPRAIGGSASGLERTPPANAVAAGVAYSQFYDNAATSPGSMNRLESNVDSVQTDPGNANVATNGTNLWLSAMEPKDNDSYLSAHESPRSSRDSSRNSYEISSNQNIDVDQSSQISGNSIKDRDDFPDHHEDNDSARGSYEL